MLKLGVDQPIAMNLYLVHTSIKLIEHHIYSLLFKPVSNSQLNEKFYSSTLQILTLKILLSCFKGVLIILLCFIFFLNENH